MINPRSGPSYTYPSVYKYKIVNLLSYQVAEIKKVLREDILTIVQNRENPHFFDIYAGLNISEYEIVHNLGYCIHRHTTVGEGNL
jgi:hypothetical protein